MVVLMPAMLRADFTTFSSTFSVTTSALPVTPSLSRKPLKALVLISSTFRPSMTMISSSAAFAERALHRKALHLLVEGVAVITGLGSKGYAAVSPHGRTLVACTGTAGALLTPRLCGGVGNLALGECALGALTAVCKVVLDAVVKHRLVRPDAEDGVGELDLADILACHVVTSM